ncbi:hypothetical protein, partial [Saccharothrix sp. Mg75]|uniref:hypothetical protein n=1 Tax=Saccharothrix sp. Mg75 TaxID=3445357 RepID=UPI003EEFB332
MFRLVAAGAVVLSLLTGGAVALGQTGGDQPATEQSPLVEDFSYPGADAIFARRGIRLVKGDGNITLVACGGAGLIEVRRSGAEDVDDDPDPGHYCFQVRGTSGYLELEVPDTFQIKGNNQVVKATVTVDEETSDVSIEKNTWTGVGYGVGDGPAVLLALKVS